MTVAIDVEIMGISEVVPYHNNPRLTPRYAVKQVAQSIDEFGFRQPIVVDVDRVIIIGHTRLEAAKLLGMDVVPVHIASNLDAQQVTALRLVDNRTQEYADWNAFMLGQELASLHDAEDVGQELKDLLSTFPDNMWPDRVTLFGRIGRIDIRKSDASDQWLTGFQVEFPDNADACAEIKRRLTA